LDSRLEKNQKIKNSLIETRLRRQSQVCKVYKVKVQDSALSKVQREQLKMVFVEAKWLVNDILNWSQLPENKPWNYKLTKTVEVKKQDTFETRVFSCLSAANRQSVQSELVSNIKTLSTLKKNGLKVGRLKFRSEVKSINLKQVNKTHRIISSKRMKIQGISGSLLVNGLKQLPENYELANAKLLNTSKGYYVALTIFINKEQENKIFKSEIGIDMGCQTAITISDGRKIVASIEETDRLKRLQRKSARQLRMNGKTTNNRRKTQLLIQKEYQKISNQKNDLANKIVADLLQHKNVYMQDENLKGWHKGGHGKAVQHSVLGRVKAKLVLSPRVIVLDRFVPTSKGCECGQKHDNLKLWDRTFVCPHCGLTEDRDVHAAKNMIRYGKDNNNIKLVRQGLSELTPADIESLAAQAIGQPNSVNETGRFPPKGGN